MIEKKFFETRTNTYHNTLASAKKSIRWPNIVRVWVEDGLVLGQATVYAYGDNVCTIKSADEYIEWLLKKKANAEGD